MKAGLEMPLLHRAVFLTAVSYEEGYPLEKE
jgi:hypothetical protein